MDPRDELNEASIDVVDGNKRTNDVVGDRSRKKKFTG